MVKLIFLVYNVDVELHSTNLYVYFFYFEPLSENSGSVSVTSKVVIM